MASQGLPNCLDGCYLLAVQMPHERGGRLHYNLHARRWTVSPGFGTHPAYWVTWTGAAAFAARHGARLPSRAEMTTETGRDDVKAPTTPTRPATPSRSPSRDWDQARSTTWPGTCRSGAATAPRPACGPGGPLAVRGSMEHPRDHAGDTRPRSRHLPGASRGVGIRLVRDHAATHAVTAAEVAGAVSTWVRSLADRDRPLRDLDYALAQALEALQPDRGLRPHVGTGAGEPGRD